MIGLDEEDYDLPADLKVKHYDCLILCSEKDGDLAKTLEQILQLHTCIKDVKSKSKLASPELITLSICSNKNSPAYLSIENLMYNSNYIFMLITRSFLEDYNFEYLYNLAINLSLQDSKEKHCTLVPLFKSDTDRSSLKIPRYLLSIDGIVLDNLIQNGTFDTLDVNHISHISFNCLCLKRIERMFSEKYPLREDGNNKRNVKIKEYYDGIKQNQMKLSSHCQSESVQTPSGHSEEQSFIRIEHFEKSEDLNNSISEFLLIEEERNSDNLDVRDSNGNRNGCEDFGLHASENDKHVSSSQNVSVCVDSLHEHKILECTEIKSRPVLKVMPFRPSCDDDDDGDDQTNPKEVISVPSSRSN